MDDFLNNFLSFTGKSLKLDLSAKDLDSNITKFGLDSLDYIEYLLALEGEFKATLDLDSLPSDATLREVYELVQTQILRQRA